MTGRLKKWLWAGAALAVLTFLVLGSVAGHVTAQTEQDAKAARMRAACPAGGSGTDVDAAQVAQQVEAVLDGGTTGVSVPGLSLPEQQIPNAKVIVATGVQMKIPDRGQIVALATALQESTLRNLPYGDRDSVGLFQQRPSQGWGTRTQILTPAYASVRFYRALKSVSGWEQMPVTRAAQTVQKSAFPDAYAKHEPLATALHQALSPTLGSAPASLAQAGPPGRADCTTQAGTGNGTIPPGTLPKGYAIPANASSTARTAIRWALQQLGTPYQWGGTCTNPHGKTHRAWCDCSSLMQRAYGVAGVQISRSTYTQIHDGTPAPAGSLRPGDLVFTEGTAARPEHVAMVIGDGLVVHAPKPGRVIEVAELSSHGQVLTARRVGT